MSVENIQVGVEFRRGGRRHRVMGDSTLQPGPVQTVDSPHGLLRQASFAHGPDSHGLRYTLLFAMPEDKPLLFMKMRVENAGLKPVFVDRIELFNAGFVYVPSSAVSAAYYTEKNRKKDTFPRIVLGPGSNELAFFSNGWQSWGYTGVYGSMDAGRRTRLGPVLLPRFNPSTPSPRRRGLFGSDMFGVFGDRTNRTALLLGFLSQEQQFGSLEALPNSFGPALRMWANGDGARLDGGEHIWTDWACFSFLLLETPDPLGPYMEAVALENRVAPLSAADVPAGWSSWYYYFLKVTDEDVRRNLQAAVEQRDSLPLQVFQIDDGFERRMGDWFEFGPGFPAGPGPLAAEIRSAGLDPGLWLAPYMVHPQAHLAKKHPDWLLRNRLGRPVNSGFTWNSLNYALDLTNPAALEYTQEVVRKAVQEWGFSFLKLDFLYAGALNGVRRDRTKTRAQVLRAGLKALREAAGPDVKLLGCGCPLGSGVGVFDAMRIGPDVEQRWFPSYNGHEAFFRHEPDMPSARNAIHNALTRSPMHLRWWVNDPDCLIVRPEGAAGGLAKLTLPEVQTLASVIALTGGALLLSEDLTALPEGRLRLAQSLLPVIGQRPYLFDWFDNPTPSRLQLDLSGPAGPWHLLALFNWNDKPATLTFKLHEFFLDSMRDYYACSFWDGHVQRISGKSQTHVGTLSFHSVPPHGTVVLAVRPILPAQPQYIGSSLHISQGLEVTGWVWDHAPEGSDARHILRARLERPGRAQGVVRLALPHGPLRAELNGQLVEVGAIGEGMYEIGVAFDHHADLLIWV